MPLILGKQIDHELLQDPVLSYLYKNDNGSESPLGSRYSEARTAQLLLGHRTA